MVCLWFQIQSGTCRCMTTNTFAIFLGTPRGKMWIGAFQEKLTGWNGACAELELCYTPVSPPFLFCSVELLNSNTIQRQLVHSWWGRSCFIDSFCVSLMHLTFCVAEWLPFQCLQWMILLFLDPWIKLFDSGIFALRIVRWDIRSMRVFVFCSQLERCKWMCEREMLLLVQH